MLTMLGLLAVIQPEVPPQAILSIEGEWRNPKGTVVISIAPCGETACGRVQWATEQAKADARKGGTDPLVGAELLKEIVPAGDGRWLARLFVPDLNKTSKAELRLLGSDRLKVTGCLVGRVVCKSQMWTRTDENEQ